MTADEYTEAQTQLEWLGSVVLNLPLDEMLTAIAHSEAVGPIVDPTLYIRASKQLGQVRELVEAFRAVQRVALSHVAQHATPTGA